MPSSPPSIASSPMARRSWCWYRAIPASANPRSSTSCTRRWCPARGLFAAGKFDQYKRNIPYATLAQAFQSLVHQILGKSDSEMSAWRSAPAGRPWPERPAHGQSDPGACPHHRRAAAGRRSSAAGPPESLPAGVPAVPRRVRAGRASPGAVPRRSAMAGYGDARSDRASRHPSRGAPSAADRRLPGQRGRFLAPAGANAGA